ncbi:hypothetical protein EXE58_05705 [Nocardioides seonyuensis]|uniref:Uncharacterized protein n=1 Tax=Nocardioides seonyuensis TaxID=2518371 RepID=A0A4P7ID02_9ACTN|nr:hypothetical protein [Nocardioides seonyuensis]QBX54999.1 hypothetical protein EXE58_05705 [Nocardioides seonyuensis]
MKRLVGLALAVVLGTTACSASRTDPAARPAQQPSPGHRTITLAPETVPPGVGVSFIQSRFDEGTRRAQVRVSNGTVRVLPVQAVGVDWAGFPGDVQPADYDVPAQSIVDLRYRLSRPDCGPDVGAAPMRGVVVTRARTYRADMPADGRRFLERLHATACAEQDIADAVDVRWDVAGEAGDGLVLSRTGRADPDPIAVEQVQGSVLFDLAVGAGAGLAAEDEKVVVPVQLSAGRCDEHARSQSTQTFIWRVWLRLGDGPLLPLVLEPPRRDHADLLAWLDRECAGYTGH